MAGNRRVFQVAERIKELVAEQLLYTADPRFSLVTITSVMVSPDLRNAKVYWVVSFLSDTDRAARIAEVNEAFEAAQGHFRRVLAKQLGVRFVPDVRFYYDDTLDTAEHVERLMERIKTSGESHD
ncbi:MAG: 30S ribosome-binding factor RbfA [Pseudomonadota bacterium]|jgi:ribosome-binding factor A